MTDSAGISSASRMAMMPMTTRISMSEKARGLVIARVMSSRRSIRTNSVRCGLLHFLPVFAPADFDFQRHIELHGGGHFFANDRGVGLGGFLGGLENQLIVHLEQHPARAIFLLD